MQLIFHHGLDNATPLFELTLTSTAISLALARPHKGYPLRGVRAPEIKTAGHKPDDKNNTATAAEIRPRGEDFNMPISARLRDVMCSAHLFLPAKIVAFSFRNLAPARAKEER